MHGSLEIEQYNDSYMSEENSKVCPYCAEQIKVTAKICPWCRQWLSMYSLRNPAVSAMVFFLCLLIFIVSFLAFFQRLLKPGVDFSPYRDSISVVESRMNLQDDDKKPDLHRLYAGPGDSRLHCSGTGEGKARRCAIGPVRSRHHALRNAVGQNPVHRSFTARSHEPSPDQPPASAPSRGTHHHSPVAGGAVPRH